MNINEICLSFYIIGGFTVDMIKAILLGIVQGVTEFLPVSSSGHLSVFSHFFGIGGEVSGLFSSMLHIGTLTAIFVVFYRDIYELFMEFCRCIRDIFKGKFSLKKMNPTRRLLMMFILSCLPLLLLLLPVGNGLRLKDVETALSTDNSILAEGICFAITGFFLLLGSAVTENAQKFRRIGPLAAVLIGVAQAIAACFPGISRSGSTISTGLCLRIPKQTMVKYSFILSIPAVVAAALMDLKDALHSGAAVSVAPIAAGVVTAAIVGLFAIRLLQFLLKKNKFKYFGYYCLILGAVVTIIGIFEALTGIYIGVKA